MAEWFKAHAWKACWGSRPNNFNFPYVIDETQIVAKDFMALCTPDFFGYFDA